MKSVVKFMASGILGGALVLGGQFLLKENNQSKLVEQHKTPANVEFRELNSQNDLYRQANWMPNLNLGAAAQGVDFRAAASNSLNSVVHVNTQIVQTRVARDPMLEFFFGPGAGREQQFKGQGSGSGVIISADGYIVTNNHVIDNAQEIEIVLNDNTSYEAKVIGTDPSTDVALLKVDAENLQPIAMGNSDNVEVGSWVLAVGNPFNLTSTVTAGIVSAKARNINLLRQKTANTNVVPIENFIQTDAAVNPGNSGGALVNIHGELIGINTAIASNTGSYTGYAFAIPVNLVKKITKDLITYGTVQRGYLGVQIQDISQELLEKEKLGSTKGVYVAGLVEDGAAEKAGIKKGDVILQINGEHVNSASELQEMVARQSPGDEVDVLIRRGFLETNKTVILKNQDGNTDIITKEELQKEAALGAKFSEVDKETLEEIGLEHGVQVSELFPGKLMSAGVPKGFIITKINQKEVHTPEDVTSMLKKTKGGILVEGKYEDGTNGYFGFGI